MFRIFSWKIIILLLVGVTIGLSQGMAHAERITNLMLDAGGDHSLSLQKDGTVWAMGKNTYGQLGDGTQSKKYSPAIVSGLSNVIAIAAGEEHSLALKADGTVWAWGNNDLKQLGNADINN